MTIVSEAATTVLSLNELRLQCHCTEVPDDSVP